MIAILAITAGGLFAVGAYLLLARSAVRLVLGLALLSHAALLSIFVAGGLVRAKPPLIPDGAIAPPPDAADAVPQALMLTAIVISFAITAFAAVLVQQLVRDAGRDESDPPTAPDAEDRA